jgi:hypothetical protein
MLAARGESTIGRVPSAARADARRRDAGDVGLSSRSANAADAPAPPEPFGRPGIAGNICVARRQRWPRIASSSRLDLARNTRARDLLYFHHGLLDLEARRATSRSLGREAGVKTRMLMSTEGAAHQASLCRAFGARVTCGSVPGLTAGPIHCRSFGPLIMRIHLSCRV